MDDFQKDAITRLTRIETQLTDEKSGLHALATKSEQIHATGCDVGKDLTRRLDEHEAQEPPCNGNGNGKNKDVKLKLPGGAALELPASTFMRILGFITLGLVLLKLYGVDVRNAIPGEQGNEYAAEKVVETAQE